MTSFLPDTHSKPLLKVLQRTLQRFFLRQSYDFLTNGKFQTDPVVLNGSTHRSIVFRSGIVLRRSTLNFRRKRRWTVTTESLFLKNCSTANTRCSVFQWAMATETALSELSAGSCPTSSTPPLPSTNHLKNISFLCSTLYLETNAFLDSLRTGLSRFRIPTGARFSVPVQTDGKVHPVLYNEYRVFTVKGG
jgi:hypothetical protein